ncbi:molybdenum cofactor guanylyltransferase MobA [Oricola sp.]|uniref:molybdenum cofactor guanylyltransferase MobA n=1 Tax=Oricola sp. TaxID=1979950 RepID=UPI003BAA8C94
MTEPATIAGAVLAGGQSRRMGADKSQLLLGGVPLVERAAMRLAPQVAEVAINANGDPQRFANLGRPVIADIFTGFSGPLAGVHAAMCWAAGRNRGYTHVATVAADTPFFPLDLVLRLLAGAADGETIAMASSGGNRHPVFGLWPVSLATDLGTWLTETDTYKVMAWVKRHRLEMCDFPLDRDGTDPFFNANTPEEFAAAERMLQITAS